MTIFDQQRGSETVEAALIDPPLGFVSISFDGDDVSIFFPEGEVDVTPITTVRAIRQRGNDVVAHWAGVPVVLAFANEIASRDVFDRLGGGDDHRAFTFQFAS